MVGGLEEADMFDAGVLWHGAALVIAQGVFIGTLAAMFVQGLVRLAWLGIKALWNKYADRIY